MAFNNIKVFLYNELVINKIYYYTYFILGSILGFIFLYNLLPRTMPSGGTLPQFEVQSVITAFSYTSYFFCSFMVCYILLKRNKIITIEGMTGSEIKITFLLFVIYSLIIFAIPLISIVCYCCFIHNLYSFYKIISIILVYFISVIFDFMFISLLMASFNTRNNLIVFAVLGFFFGLVLFVCPLIINDLIEPNHSYSQRILTCFFTEKIFWNNIINEQKIPIKIVATYKSNPSLGFSIDVLNFYLSFAGIINLILLWYYFDSIRVEKYLMSLPLFKEIASK